MPCYKVIKSGHILEVYKYQTNLIRGENKSLGGRKREGGNVERKEEYSKTSGQRRRNNLRRLILNNFGTKDRFITLTFRDTEDFDVTNIDDCNREFKKFIQRLKRRYKDIDLKYLAVIEFQMENDRGAVHYHMFCNIPLEWKNKMELRKLEREFAQNLWKHGFADIVGIKSLEDVDNVGAYLINYMTKDIGLLQGKKAYLHSRNLNKSEVLEGEELTTWLDTLEGISPVFTSEYESFFNGIVKYKEYNLKRGK